MWHLHIKWRHSGREFPRCKYRQSTKRNIICHIIFTGLWHIICHIIFTGLWQSSLQYTNDFVAVACESLVAKALTKSINFIQLFNWHDINLLFFVYLRLWQPIVTKVSHLVNGETGVASLACGLLRGKRRHDHDHQICSESWRIFNFISSTIFFTIGICSKTAFPPHYLLFALL
jgi:hypothetical protein